MIARIVSGGQSGSDLGALQAAKASNTPTGGTMPKGWRTLDGPRPEYAELYGMTEHTSPAYPPRTWANVEAADVTICIAAYPESPGEQLTLRACKKLGKPRALIGVYDWESSGGIGHPLLATPSRYSWAEQDVFDAIELIHETERRLGRDVVVNVAGNSEKTAPGIGVVALGIVRMILNGACGGP